MKDLDLSILTYSNIKHSDAWEIYVGQMKELFPFDVDHYFLVDTVEGTNPSLTDHMIKVYYDDATQTVSEQYTSALENVKTKYFIHDMEDFILYDRPNSDQLIECMKFLDENEYDFVRLIKCGISESNVRNVKDNFYLIDSSDPYSYSHATTIWKTDSFNKIHNFMIDYKNKNKIEPQKFKGTGREGNTKKMLDINKEGFINDVCKENDLTKGVYYYDGEPSVPRTNHYYSNIYPFIMTAIKGSKWNFESYAEIITSLFHKYNIKPTRELLK